MRKAPLFIRVSSWFFIFMGVVSLGTLISVWQNSTASAQTSISFLTNKFTFASHPGLYSATCLLLCFSGMTGLAILLKRPYAYDLGIVYCVVGLLFFLPLIVGGVGLINGPIAGCLTQIAVFGGFLTYLLRHRLEWKEGGKVAI